MQLAQVEARFRVGAEEFALEYTRIHAAMVADVNARQRAGKITRRNLESQAQSTFRGRKAALRAVEAIGLGVGQAGAEDVAGELARQEEEAGSDAFALTRQVEILEERIETLARVSVGRLWDRVIGQALAEWERLDRQYPPGSPGRQAKIDAGLERFLGELSTKPLEDLARQTSGVAYNEGRRAEIDSAAEQDRLEYVVRSEILDNRTCDVCRVYALDPPVFKVGTPEYYEFFPPAGCLGDDRCRGFYVPIARDLVEGED